MRTAGRLALLFIGLGLALSGCKTRAAREAEMTDPQVVYQRGHRALLNGDYPLAIKIYEALMARYPFVAETRQSRLDVIYAYYRAGESESAIDAADTFIRENPTHPRIDYAWYLKGLTDFERLPNFIAMKEASFNSERFLEISRVALALRPEFSMIAGVEFLAPSVPLGGKGSYSSAGAICPNLCTALYEACAAGESVRARELQFKLARLWDLFREQYPSSLKGGMVVMGRPVGPTRPPLPTATKERQAYIETHLGELGIIDSEPHGW
jgi:tetratricopeptide (TPR) repeat protein